MRHESFAHPVPLDRDLSKNFGIGFTAKTEVIVADRVAYINGREIASMIVKM